MTFLDTVLKNDMIVRFKDFYTLIKEGRPGTYVSVKLDPASSKKLYAFAEKSGITDLVPKSDYHCTLVYSKHGIPEAEKEDLNLPITAKISGFELFDTKLSETGKCLVARLDSSDLVKAHRMYHTKYPAVYTFPEYKPHVTISYNYDGPLPEKTPRFNLSFDEREFKDLDVNWKP